MSSFSRRTAMGGALGLLAAPAILHAQPAGGVKIGLVAVQTGPQAALASLVERLRQSGVREDDFVDCIETLRHAFAENFGRSYTVPDLELREKAADLIGGILERETSRQATLAVIASEIEQSSTAQERLQQFLSGNLK